MNNTLGVSLEDAWSQSSLLAQPPSGPKSSKYTVPIPTQQHQHQHQHQHQPIVENFSGNTMGNEYGNSMPIPISEIPFAPQMQPHASQQPYQHPQHQHQQPNQYQQQSSEIPYLREQLTQQSNTVADCTKQLTYLKALNSQLKKELYELSQSFTIHKQRSKEDKQKKWFKMIFSIFVIVALIILLIVTVQLHQKVTKVLSQPLL